MSDPPANYERLAAQHPALAQMPLRDYLGEYLSSAKLGKI